MISEATSSPERAESVSVLLRRLIFVAATLYLALLVFNWVTRTGRFSPDSMNYVNVAQNILAGKGITQPTLGFNQPTFSLDEKTPVPLLAQAPLYPVAIALVSRLGIPVTKAALLLSACAAAAIFILTYMLATELYDSKTGLLAAALLTIYHPMRWMMGWTWNDPIGVALVLFALWLLVMNQRRSSFAITWIAGLIAGLGFATRFALLPLFVVGVLFLACSNRQWRARLIGIAGYAVGFTVPAGAVATRNFMLTGAFAPPFNPVRVAIGENVSAVWRTTFGHYVEGLSYSHSVQLLCLWVAAICILLAWRRQLAQGLNEIFLREGRWILTLWSIGYLVFLIFQRSRSYFDVDARTIAPTGVILVVLWSAAVVRAVRIPATAIGLFTVALLAFATWQEAGATIKTRPLDLQRYVTRSERLTWLANNTSDNDLIIGDDVIDIPFFLRRPATLSFSPYPYTNYPTYEKIMAYAHKHCNDYQNIFLVLHRNLATEQDWRSAFGDFFGDLMAGAAEKYPGITLVQPLKDGVIFQVACR